MKIQRTDPFLKDFKKLPDDIKRRVEKALRFLVSNPRHPSLKARMIDKKRRIWKANVNGGYRFTFTIEKGFYRLRAVGAHGEMERPERW